MDKSPDAFRTISEVAEVLDTPAHVLRFWESRFPQVRPVKRAGGRRYYRPSDVALLAGIKRLLHDEGLTIRGVQKMLRDQGARHVAGLADGTLPVDTVAQATTSDADAGTVNMPEEVPEAGFIAVEDDEFEAEAEVMPSPPPPVPARTRAAQRAGRLPEQPSLPLFDAPEVATGQETAAPVHAPPASAPGHPPPKPPSRRDDATLASLIRALPKGHAGASGPHVAALARRLSELRTTLADRAAGLA